MAQINLSPYIIPKKVGDDRDAVYDKVYLADIPVDKNEEATYQVTDYACLCGAKTSDVTGLFAGNGKKILPMPSGGVKSSRADPSYCIVPAISLNGMAFQQDPDLKAAVDEKNHTIQFGEYPQSIASNNHELEEVYQQYLSGEDIEDFGETGRLFTGYFVSPREGVKQNPEFVYKGKKYVRVTVNPKASADYGFRSADGEVVEWCEVEPITWQFKTWPISAEKGSGCVEIYAQKALASGLPFFPTIHPGAPLWRNCMPRGFLNGLNMNDKTKNTGITATGAGNFQGDGFLDDIMSASFEDIKKEIQTRKTGKRKAYVTQQLTPNQQLLACISAGQAVFLHGPSGVGKSARVRAMDPDVTQLTLRPQMNPEEVDGVLNRETGKYLPPYWYTELCRKCEAEPNKKHVLFIDELANVSPTVQSLVYSIVLDRAGKDGLWPLPDNAVVVAAGNENADNAAAYPLTNALFRRFNHVYFDVDKSEWLDWAAGVSTMETTKPQNLEENIPQHMHPFIMEYVRSRGMRVLYEDLDEENPKIVTDPRKWEIASKLLYATHNLMAIEPAVGSKIAGDFADFVNTELPQRYMTGSSESMIDADGFGLNDDFETYRKRMQESEVLKRWDKATTRRENATNAYGFTFDSLNDDQLLAACIESGQSVFLHGPSGVGKSARVREIDPDATHITLRPQMNPEEVDGVLNRETNTYIPPIWYTELCRKCEAEPDKKHVLFIDELTNVKPTVQSLVYSIVLDRAGKNGMWPLPDNAVVVAAGNEQAGNLAAYPLTNALHRRFNHVYYDVDITDWLEWGCKVEKEPLKMPQTVQDEKKAKVHPAIIAYVMSRPAGVLYQGLDEDDPKIVTDPRKWEIASEILYATKNPNALLPAIGKELTKDFVDFVQMSTITAADILTGKAKASDFAGADIAVRLSNICGLVDVDAEDLPVIRKFVGQAMGAEVLATYDSLWIKNDPDRAIELEKAKKTKTVQKKATPFSVVEEDEEEEQKTSFDDIKSKLNERHKTNDETKQEVTQEEKQEDKEEKKRKGLFGRFK